MTLDALVYNGHASLLCASRHACRLGQVCCHGIPVGGMVRPACHELHWSAFSMCAPRVCSKYIHKEGAVQFWTT